MNNPTMLPFIFARLTPESREAYENNIAEKLVIQDWIVIIAAHSLKLYNSTWMADDAMGNYCFTPDVDISKEEQVFPTFEKAREFVKQWWINN